jgi:hypothetical protein
MLNLRKCALGQVYNTKCHDKYCRKLGNFCLYVKEDYYKTVIHNHYCYKHREIYESIFSEQIANFTSKAKDDYGDKGRVVITRRDETHKEETKEF